MTCLRKSRGNSSVDRMMFRPVFGTSDRHFTFVAGAGQANSECYRIIRTAKSLRTLRPVAGSSGFERIAVDRQLRDGRNEAARCRTVAGGRSEIPGSLSSRSESIMHNVRSEMPDAQESPRGWLLARYDHDDMGRRKLRTSLANRSGFENMDQVTRNSSN